MASRLREMIRNPMLKGIGINDDKVLSVHRQILTAKPLLRSAYEEFYSLVNDLVNERTEIRGQLVELGSGAGFAKEILHDAQTSDVRQDPSIDLYLDAMNMPFEANSIRAFFGINVFHHFENPQAFLEEVTRTLCPGGICILIEPHSGLLSKFVHKRIHDDEFFDLSQSDWQNPRVTGPLSGANQALSDIIFLRDRAKFEMLFGSALTVSHLGYVPNQLRFLLSGGVNYIQIAPTKSLGWLIKIEKLLKPFNRWFSLHQVWVIEKKKTFVH